MNFELGLGCWALGNDSYGELSDAEASEILENAYDNGIRFYDTSPTYGSGLSEIRLGKFLVNKQDVLIASKVGMLPHNGLKIPYNFSRKIIESSINESLKRLKRESIYLIQLHSPIFQFEREYPEVFDIMAEIVNSGKVQKFGISLRSPSLIDSQSKLFDWKSYQYNLSILDQRISDFIDKEYVNSRSDLHFIARTPLNFGFLTDSPPKYGKLSANHHLSAWSFKQLKDWENRALIFRNLLSKYNLDVLTAALRFPIDSGLANLVIPGVSSVSELMKNISAFNSQKLDENMIRELTALFFKIEKEGINSPYAYQNSK